MPLSTSTAFRQLTDGSQPGTIFGRTTTDPIAFWGGTPVIQPVFVLTATNSALGGQTASSGGFGASTAAIMTSTLAAVAALIVDVAAIRAALSSTAYIAP